jgi:hypothetical protein
MREGHRPSTEKCVGEPREREAGILGRRPSGHLFLRPAPLSFESARGQTPECALHATTPGRWRKDPQLNPR